MASCVHDPSLKAMYVESTNHWRHLAEQMKSTRPDHPERRAITDMARNPYSKPSILETPRAAVRQIAQSGQDDVKSDKTADHQHQLVLRHNAEHLDTDQKKGNPGRQKLKALRDHAENQRESGGRHGLDVNSVGQIDARRDPLTGQWECLLS